MLTRLFLILVQLIVGWFVALEIMKTLPRVPAFEIFIMATISALVVWAVGVLAGAVLRDVSKPGPGAFLFAFGTAVLFAAVAIFPDVQRAISSVTGQIDLRIYPLVGAVIGYAIQN